MNLYDLILLTKDNPDLLTIEATVITGFEFLAYDECREKCKPLSIAKTKGRIFFNIPAEDFNKVLTLRSVDNIFLVTETIKEISFEEDKDNDLNIVKSFVEVVNWEKSLNKWRSISGFKGIIYPSKDEIVKSLKEKSGENKPPEIEISENVIGKAEDDNITDDTNSKTDNKKRTDIDSVVDGVNKTCFSRNHDTPDSVEFEDISKVNLNTDSIYLEDSGCDSTSVNKMVCDLVSKIDADKKANDDSSADLEVKPEDKCCRVDSSFTVVQDSENPSCVSPESNTEVEFSQAAPFEEGTNLVCGDVELIKVEDLTIQGACQGNDIENSEKCPPILTDGQSNIKNEKRPHRGRTMEIERNNNGRTRGRRPQRGNVSRQNKPGENTGILKFRATCYRVGGKHSFSSMEAACEFGGSLQDKFGWTVDLTQFDLNVILNIEKNQAYICLALTTESLHRRNITHFSNTTLRATICYNLFRLAEPMTGEIVIDPLCGGGSIPIEGALSFPNTYHICGDYNDRAVIRTRANIQHVCKTKTELKVGAVKWNAKSLPLRAQSVDVFVSDLPFGRRSGCKQDNQRLYSSVLFELAKVIRTGTGRACLLTYDRTALTRALRSQNTYWREIRQFGVNQGGLFSTVFLLLRRASPVLENADVAVNVPLKSNHHGSAKDKSATSKSKALEGDSVLSVEANDEPTTLSDPSSLKEKQLPATVIDMVHEGNTTSDNINLESSSVNPTNQSGSLLNTLPLDNSELKEDKSEDITREHISSEKIKQSSIECTKSEEEEKVLNEKSSAENSAQSASCEDKYSEDALVLSVEMAKISVDNLNCSENVSQLSDENVTKADQILSVENNEENISI